MTTWRFSVWHDLFIQKLSISRQNLIVGLSKILSRTVVGDWRFLNLTRSRRQSHDDDFCLRQPSTTTLLQTSLTHTNYFNNFVKYLKVLNVSIKITFKLFKMSWMFFVRKERSLQPDMHALMAYCHWGYSLKPMIFWLPREKEIHR